MDGMDVSRCLTWVYQGIDTGQARSSKAGHAPEGVCLRGEEQERGGRGAHDGQMEISKRSPV